ncbi:hypothetical protein [Limnospira platensis]|uniref:hypothetical protein n=2 Tax=Limnospira platensis TaxID=118562 RepID=UPI0024C88A6E|nr:hypothetical protein AP9108_36580 [Arthrospira sp. PCC 9108]
MAAAMSYKLILGFFSSLTFRCRKATPSAIGFSQGSAAVREGNRPLCYLNRSARFANSRASSTERLTPLAAIAKLRRGNRLCDEFQPFRVR